jgi:hypothetical protein
MCTAVVGGLIHRAATRISTARDQRSATPMRNHLRKDRRELFRGGASRVVSGVVSGFSVTFQNNRLGLIDNSARVARLPKMLAVSMRKIMGQTGRFLMFM